MGRITRTTFGLVKQIRLTDAQIKTLFSVPIVLVPAKANVEFQPFDMLILSQTTAGAYATTAHIQLGIVGTASLFQNITLTNSGLDSGALTSSFNGVASGAAMAAWPNSAIILTANADPTGGDPANYAIFTLFYAETPTV